MEETSTILYETFLLKESSKLRQALQNGTYKSQGFQSFRLVEHGKARDIDALHISDRTVQKCLCRELLTEAFSRSFIADNSASLPGKGMDYAFRRIKKHLRGHYRKHGLAGGIYQFDFKSFFASLPHNAIKHRLRKRILDDRVYLLAESFVDDFKRMKTAVPGEAKGVGLGSEISQIIALDYASPIDHYIKDVLGVKGYGRYMDDGYIISESLEKLREQAEAL